MTLLHHGMIIVGVPYTCPELSKMNEITGGTPYGVTTLAKDDGSRQPSANELAIARFQGKHVAEITKKLHGYPAQRFRSLINDLGTLCRNYAIANNTEFCILTTPTRLQQRIFELLGIILKA